jgi:hypothetical protein
MRLYAIYLPLPLLCCMLWGYHLLSHALGFTKNPRKCKPKGSVFTVPVAITFMDLDLDLKLYKICISINTLKGENLNLPLIFF